jgi:hypothetical protein
MERDASAATAALADIDAQQHAVRRRLDAQRWPPPALGLLLGALAASLVWRDGVLFTVVTVLYFASLLPLLGTPARLGVVPRDGRRSFALIFVAVVFVAGTPTLAMTGPWWTAIVAGVGAAVFVPVFGRWRRAQVLRDLPGPAVRRPSAFVRRVDAVIVRSVFVPVAAVVMAGAVLAWQVGWVAAGLAYVPGMLLVQRRLFLVGGIPAEERGTARFRAGLFASLAVVHGTPVFIVFEPGNGGWPVAMGHAAVVAATVLLVGRWQQRRLDAGASPR